MWHANKRFSVLALKMLHSEKCLQKSSKLDLAASISLAKDLNLEEGDKWIGCRKHAYISWYPGQNHKFLLPNEPLESKLKPGPVHLDGHVFTLRILQCAEKKQKKSKSFSHLPRRLSPWSASSNEGELRKMMKTAIMGWRGREIEKGGSNWHLMELKPKFGVSVPSRLTLLTAAHRDKKLGPRLCEHASSLQCAQID